MKKGQVPIGGIVGEVPIGLVGDVPIGGIVGHVPIGGIGGRVPPRPSSFAFNVIGSLGDDLADFVKSASQEDGDPIGAQV